MPGSSIESKPINSVGCADRPPRIFEPQSDSWIAENGDEAEAIRRYRAEATKIDEHFDQQRQFMTSRNGRGERPSLGTSVKTICYLDKEIFHEAF